MKQNISKKFFNAVFRRFSSKQEKGVVLLVTLLLMLGIGVLGIGVVVNSSLNASVAKNYIGKLQSFYAADGQVAWLAQETFDGNASKYFGAAASCGGAGNIIQNCDFSGGTTSWNNASPATDEGGACAGTTSGGKYNLHVTNGGIAGHTWDCEFGQTGLTLTQGLTYTLRFDARCSTNRKMNVAVEDVGKWTAFSGFVDFYMTTTMQTYSMDFVMNAATVNNAGLWFQAGGQDTFGLWVGNVYLAPVSNTSANLARGKTTYRSSVENGSLESSNAVDGNTGTRWASAWADNQYITVDLGQTCLVAEVVLKWEAAFATNYEILLSSNNTTWFQAYQDFAGAGGNEVITFSPQVVRYVRMHGINRATTFGFSLYEFEIYGSTGGRSGNGKTYTGGDTVSWSLTEVIPSAGFNIVDTAFKKFGTGKRTFNSQLAQYVELPTGGLVNPWGAVANIPVTYYDFHSDRSNPEFEQPNCGGSALTLGMVQNSLDFERKPQLNGASKELNSYIARWFRPWQAGQHNFPRYTNNWGLMGGAGDGNEFIRCPNAPLADGFTAGNDMSFANVVIPDVLPLTHIGNGMYRYANDFFFPIDGRGFGNEWHENGAASHNYAFTMELKTTFTKVPGQIFFFSGDDDVWVFINNSLVMDLGGIHTRAQQQVNVDDIAGLVDGNTYNFDFFYCERHSSDAEMTVMTNLLTFHAFTQQRVQWKRSYGNIN
jgi:fibro-slime domain-containing protein